MAVRKFPPRGDEDESAENFRQFFNPGQVDGQIRQAIQFCWMALPREKRNVEEVERQIRRMVDRALRNLREDEQQFGGEGTGKGAE